MELIADKFSTAITLARLSYCLLIHNQTAFELSKFTYYRSSFRINLISLFSNQPVHFGIGTLLEYSPPSNYDRNCVVALYYTQIQKLLFPWRFHFDTTDLTATSFVEAVPAGAIRFDMDYLVSCYGPECRLGTYFDQPNMRCSPCPSVCADCFNPAHCLNCTTNHYLLIMNTCISCSLLISNCLTCETDSALNQTICLSCTIPFFVNVVG